MPAYLSRSRNLATRRLEDETIIMSVRSSTLYTLNESATRIWQAADGQTSIEDIARTVVVEEYEVDYDTALQDILALVRRLADDGLLVVHENPLSATDTGAA